MKHCQTCNLDFPDAFRFCGSCGGALTSSLRCSNCGELTDGRWAFCTNCGAKVSTQTTTPVSDHKSPKSSPTSRDIAPPTLTLPPSEGTSTAHRPRAGTITHEWYSAADLYDEETVTAAPAPPPPPPRQVIPETKPSMSYGAENHAASEIRTAPALTMLSAYAAPEAPSDFRWWPWMVPGLFALILVGVLGVGGWYWWSHRGSPAQPSAPTNSSPAALTGNPSASPLSTPASTIAPAAVTRSADEEIKQFREKRAAAKPSESAAIISALEQAEKKYPSDYRFPYELSKLSIKGVISHHEAFEPLSRAAEKAIDNGKADEMLSSLMADKDGDFYKLSRGHHEWETLQRALRDKDKGALKELKH